MTSQSSHSEVKEIAISPEALAQLGDGQIAYVKTIRSEDVRAQERVGIENRPIDVRLGCEIHDDVKRPMREQIGNGALVGNIALDERITQVVHDVGEVGRVCGVRNRIEIHDADVGPLAQGHAHEIRADESETAGNEPNLSAHRAGRPSDRARRRTRKVRFAA